MTYLAHTENAKGVVHNLDEHLKSTAERAARMMLEASSDAGAEQLARWCGLLHDAGKYRDEFQAYLQGTRKGDVETHHAVYGAGLATTRGSDCAAFAIAAHHAGLHDADSLQSLIEKPSYNVRERLPEIVRRVESGLGAIPPEVSQPKFVDENLRTSVLIRMLFSTLVDADFLDTEAHYAPELVRPAMKLDADILLAKLEQERERKSRVFAEASANNGNAANLEVGAIRNRVFEACKRNGKLPHGFFSLSVPTGGSKTMASMAFALAHANQNDLRRVIVVIPYLSIIEQNAAEYRRILDPENAGVVIEHHSAVQVPARKEGDEGSRTSLELATENWDAPIVITTAVQFIESLFAYRPAQCRKLHNIARSVVIFDEAQTIPSHLLNPLLGVLRVMRDDYKTSFVFSTATQPAFARFGELTNGFIEGEVTPLVEDSITVFKTLRRVRFEVPAREEKLTWKQVADEMQTGSQAMCVVNTRRQAFELYSELQQVLRENTSLDSDCLFHLSSAMCAEHRLGIIGAMHEPQEGSIRHRLLHNEPCLVVSTQLIEAGVDVDSPFVMRALAPLDSIVQAAGRCNREGRLRDESGIPVLGRVRVFRPADESLPQGVYRTATDETSSLLNAIDAESLAVDAELFPRYFKRLFGKIPTDKGELERELIAFNFRRAAKIARVIEDETTSVIVQHEKYGAPHSLVKKLQARARAMNKPFIARDELRRLQRHFVNLRPRDFETLKSHGQVSPLFPDLQSEIYLLNEGSYHERLGVLVQGRPAEEMIL